MSSENKNQRGPRQPRPGPKFARSFAPLLLSVLAACGPEVGDGTDDRTPEYVFRNGGEDQDVFRDGRELEYVLRTADSEEIRYCGTIREEVFADLSGTLEQLDPDGDFIAPTMCDTPLPGEPTEPFVFARWGSLQLEGFSQSPFDCWWFCCADELAPIGRIYYYASLELTGSGNPFPDPDGEPLEVVESVRECSEP